MAEADGPQQGVSVMVGNFAPPMRASVAAEVSLRAESNMSLRSFDAEDKTQ